MTGSEPVTVTVPLEKMEKLPELRVRYSSNRNVMIKSVSEKNFLFTFLYLELLAIFKHKCYIEVTMNITCKNKVLANMAGSVHIT
jgi:hypothetical protein